MKLGKATIYFYNLEGVEPLDVLEQVLDSRDWVSYDVFNYESVEIGDWYDSIDLNNSSKTKDEKTYLNYFTEGKRAIQTIAIKVANIMALSEYIEMDMAQAIGKVYSTMRINGDIPTIELTDGMVQEIVKVVNWILESWE